MRIPNKTEQFDFFTNEKFTPDEEEEEAKEKKDGDAATAVDEQNQAQDTTEKTTLLMDMDDFIETEYHKSIYISHIAQKKLERQYLFMPSGKNGNFKTFYKVSTLTKLKFKLGNFSTA